MQRPRFLFGECPLFRCLGLLCVSNNVLANIYNDNVNKNFSDEASSSGLEVAEFTSYIRDYLPIKVFLLQ